MQPLQQRFLYALLLVTSVPWFFVSVDKTGLSTSGRTTGQPGYLIEQDSNTAGDRQIIRKSGLEEK